MIQNPVFIVGTERSGSNLLRLLLNELPEVTIPHPPHLMRDLDGLVSRYGDLRYDLNFRRLVRHAIRLVELHFAPWPMSLSVDQVVAEAPERDLYSIYAAIYEQYRTHLNKPRWGCKSTFMIHHVDKILAHHARPQFVHLVRDPRDVAVSARNSVFSHYHPYYVAELWKREQALAMRYSAELPAGVWHTLRYEDLIREPEARLRELCTFLSASYSDSLLRFFERVEAKKLSSLSRSWENVGKPILSGNSGKFTTALSAWETALIESLARAEMEAYGYTPESRRPATAPSALNKVQFGLSEQWQSLRQESLALFKDKNAGYRLRKKAFLWSLHWR